ncbi:MAG: hypothetical protein KKF98_04540 [Bacteroidetes bacterium]|nr:hypothetical protein [Bacteroidota bacterium]
MNTEHPMMNQERENHCTRPVGFFSTRRVEKKHQPDFDPTGFAQPGGSGVRYSVFKRSDERVTKPKAHSLPPLVCNHTR